MNGLNWLCLIAVSLEVALLIDSIVVHNNLRKLKIKAEDKKKKSTIEIFKDGLCDACGTVLTKYDSARFEFDNDRWEKKLNLCDRCARELSKSINEHLNGNEEEN